MKKRRRITSRRRASSRRWHIPPPLIHGPDKLEGGSILSEWENELGVVLWQTSRDALLWATTSPEHRAETFADPGERYALMIAAATELVAVDPRFRTGMKVLQQLVRNPAGTRDDQVSRACRLISDWAYEQGRFATALAFAQNAALATRKDAGAAFWVATLAVRLNDHARAEVWFRRAIGLARQSRDWRMYSRSFGGLGNLYLRRGNLPAARRLHTRALRGARRGGMRREQAAALHDLFAVAVETNSPAEAERLARHALEAYGTRNRRVHVLAHDVAYYWMEQGQFARALPVFQAVLPLIERPVEKLFVLADLARAAAGVGDELLARSAATQVRQILDESDMDHGAGRALLEVARGFQSLGDLALAEVAATDAIAAATRFRESKVRFAAEAVLEAIRTAQPVPDSTTVPTEVEVSDETLASDFVRTLEMVAGAAH